MDNLSSQANYKIKALLLSFAKRAILWRSIKILRGGQTHLVNGEPLIAEMEYIALINFCEQVLYEIQHLMDQMENCTKVSENLYRNTRQTIHQIDLVYILYFIDQFK